MDQHTILIIDDADSVRTLLRISLERQGYIVHEESDGQAGVARARQVRPDLILMDIEMPLLNGIQALQALRRDEGLAGVPVVAITALGMAPGGASFRKAGFTAYVQKPFELETVAEVIRRCLADVAHVIPPPTP